jgi:hypothetical protein
MTVIVRPAARPVGVDGGAKNVAESIPTIVTF